MVKHTQTIRWLLPTNWFNVFDHFVGWYLKKVNTPTANVPINLKPPSDLVYKLIDWR